MEHRPTDSRRRSASAHCQARNADDGRLADYRVGDRLDFAVGATVGPIHLAYDFSDVGIRGNWIRGRLRQTGEAAQPRIDGASEASVPTNCCSGDLAGAVYLDAIF